MVHMVGFAKVGHCGGLRPPTQQAMEEPGGGQTSAHMLRMAGELRAEGGVPPAKAAADLGLRQVPRPQTMTVRAASMSAAGTPGDNVEVIAERSPEGVTVRSDSPAHSVASSSST